MGLFVCDLCGCVENTALGHYWAKDMTMFSDPKLKGKALCSECAPSKYKGGEDSEYGKWHGKFPKRQWDGKRDVINRKVR